MKNIIAKSIEKILIDWLNPTNTVKTKITKSKLAKNIVPKNEWPEFMQTHNEIKNIYVGCCVHTGEWSDVPRPNSAHTHTRGKYRGIICFRTMKDLQKKTTCWHELAHVLSSDHSNHGHNRVWAEQYVKLVNGEKKWLTVEWLQKKYKFK